MSIKRLLPGAALLAAAALLTGCAGIDDPAAFRREHIRAFRQELRRREAVLDHPLTLGECIALAMKGNYDSRQAELKKRLAQLDRNLSFADFLPTVTATAGLTTWSIPQSANGVQMADKTYRKATIDATLPVLVPAAYFLFQNARLNVDVAELSAHFTRQAIILQTGVAFFQSCLYEKMIATLETQVAAAETLRARVAGLAAEGLASAWESSQADYLLAARRATLAAVRRDFSAQKGELLRLLGLSPLADIRLNGDLSLDPLPNATVETFVLDALQQHPSLSIADHQVVAAENSVRAAIASFIPTVSTFANASWNSDSFAKHVSALYGGFTAAVDLFDGFAKYNRYQAAKVSRTSAELDREATFLSIILEVVKAHNALKDADDNLVTAAAAFRYLDAKFRDYEARQKEGLITVNDMLDAQGEAQAAETDQLKATFQTFLARIQFDMATGSLQVPGEQPSPLLIRPAPLTPDQEPSPDAKDDKPLPADN